MADTPWYVYMLRCSDGTLYTGVTLDLKRRVVEHNKGAPPGAKYTHPRRPVTLVWSMLCANRETALKKERAIKRMPRHKKKALALLKSRELKKREAE